MVRLHVSRTRLKDHEACLISITVNGGIDPDLAYAEYVQKLKKRCDAKIGIFTSLDLPLHLFLALLRATAEVLGTAAVTLPKGVLVVFASPDVPFKPGKVVGTYW